MDDQSTDLVPSPGELDFNELTRHYDRSRLEKITRKHSRTNNAVHDAFDLIGGVPRLAIWADQNPGEFFTKILPRTIQSAQQQEHSGEIVIRTAIPRTALDGEYEDVTPPPPPSSDD